MEICLRGFVKLFESNLSQRERVSEQKFSRVEQQSVVERQSET
jgi:hypothetical protein